MKTAPTARGGDARPAPTVRLLGHRPAMYLANGWAFPIVDPLPVDVHFPSFVHHLARLPRYAGATAAPFSVAEHSCLVAELAPEAAKPYALLHDFHEAVLGDWITPVKAAVRQVVGEAMLSAGAEPAGDADGAFCPFEALSRPIDRAVHAAAGLPWPPPPEIAAAVAEADRDAFLIEVRAHAPREMRQWAAAAFGPRLAELFEVRTPHASGFWLAERTLAAAFDDMVERGLMSCPPIGLTAREGDMVAL